MELFYEESYKDIIEDDTDQNKQEIAKELHAPMEYRTWKYHMTHEHKTSGKTNQKRNDECGYIGFE